MKHIHYWLVERPSGPTSMGRCKECGAEREFNNSPNHRGQWPSESAKRGVSAGVAAKRKRTA